VASAASRLTLWECCGLTQLWVLAERERGGTPSLAHHLLPGEARSACIQSGVEPPHSTIHHDLCAKVSPQGEGGACPEPSRSGERRSVSPSPLRVACGAPPLTRHVRPRSPYGESRVTKASGVSALTEIMANSPCDPALFPDLE